MQTIYLAAGCFWGSEAYFKKIDGIVETTVGYANGLTVVTDYQHVYDTDHAEAVKLIYDETVINLTEILAHYFRIIDPCSVNKQGEDVGRQYRTGIYCENAYQLACAVKFIKLAQQKYDYPIAVEVEKIKNFIAAEDYHQDYLDKNTQGYCHVNLSLAQNDIHLEELEVSQKELLEAEVLMQDK